MTKKVALGLPISNGYPPPLPPPINPAVAKVAEHLLGSLPKTPLPPPPRLSAAPAAKGNSRSEVLTFKIPLNDTHSQKPPDLNKARSLMQKGDEAPTYQSALFCYFQALQLLENTLADQKGLLLKAICYLKSAGLQLKAEKDHHEDTQEAKVILEAIFEKLLNPSSPESQDDWFVTALATAYLTVYVYVQDEGFLKKAGTLFRKAAKLMERKTSSISSLKNENQDPLRHKIALGLAFSHFYEVKSAICSLGTGKTSFFLEHLEKSRLHLEQARALQDDPHMSYMLALNHALIALLIDQEKSEEKSSAIVERLDCRFLQHLHNAVQILDTLRPKTEFLILLGIVQYQLAFGQWDPKGHIHFDPVAGLTAENYLSNAYQKMRKAEENDDLSLTLCCGDCARQLAWLVPCDHYQERAQSLLEEASAENVFGASLFWMFTTQTALRQLVKVNAKLTGIDKTTIAFFQESFSKLELTLSKNSECPFYKAMKKRLKALIEFLQQDYVITPSKTVDEARKYTSHVFKIGDTLNKISITSLFEYALMERIRAFDLTLDLDF